MGGALPYPLREDVPLGMSLREIYPTGWADYPAGRSWSSLRDGRDRRLFHPFGNMGGKYKEFTKSEAEAYLLYVEHSLLRKRRRNYPQIFKSFAKVRTTSPNPTPRYSAGSCTDGSSYLLLHYYQ